MITARMFGWLLVVIACGGLLAALAGFAHELMTGAPSIWETHFFGSLIALALGSYFLKRGPGPARGE